MLDRSLSSLISCFTAQMAQIGNKSIFKMFEPVQHVSMEVEVEIKHSQCITHLKPVQ